MGEHTKFSQASFSFGEPDAMIEAVRRMRDSEDENGDWVYELTLNDSDTEMMISWLDTAYETKWLTISHYGEWSAWFKEHRASLLGNESANPLTEIHGSHFKIMIVAIWTAVTTGDTTSNPFWPSQLAWMHDFYSSVLATLDIELV